MVDNLLTVGKYILFCVPVIMLGRSLGKVNMEKNERRHQFLLPFIALLFVLLTTELVHTLNDFVVNLMYAIPNLLKTIGGFLPGIFGQIFRTAGNILKKVVEASGFSYAMFLMTNITLVDIYFVVKQAYIIIIRKIISKDSLVHEVYDMLYQAVCGRIYGYDKDSTSYYLNEKFVQPKNILEVTYNLGIYICAGIMIVTYILYTKGELKSVFYPAFTMILISEIFFFLDGTTKYNPSDNVSGEDDSAVKTANYTLLRNVLRGIFGDKVLAENTVVNSILDRQKTNDEVIRVLSESKDEKIADFASYIRKLNLAGEEIDHDYLNSAVELLNKQSILFNNPFYNDLSPYIFYPMNMEILQHKKVLIISGRHAIESDIEEWVRNGLEKVTNIPDMWNIGVLKADKNDDPDVGILTNSDVYNLALHEKYSDFFRNVGYVVIIEPSRLVSTAQIGLSLLIKKCRGEEENQITYCMCDKNCDGLVDAMSHILLTSITEVSATKKNTGTSSYMCWDTDDEYWHHRIIPGVSRYLGMGTELSVVGLRSQISKVQWFGGNAFPVIDMRWIYNQYFYALMKYASLPAKQETLSERMSAHINLWSAKKEDCCYVTVEDESYNMFEILRNFSTRAKTQGFVNVISTDYLLKEYMAVNAQIFESDAKAIPYVSADYVRSNRNSALKMILMMSAGTVNEGILKKEFSLMGINIFDLKKQLWFEIFKCYSNADTLAGLPEEYEDAVSEAAKFELQISRKKRNPINIDVIQDRYEFNEKTGENDHVFLINDSDFVSCCVDELKSAGYVAEDEKGDKYYLGSELTGHIYQKYLPGQFLTFGGKYYEMRYLTSDGQVLLRRAADHINGRVSYRQMRRYSLSGICASEHIGDQKQIGNTKIVHEYADIDVSTPGYYQMQNYNDFSTARKVLFEGDKSGIPQRQYFNKEILRIDLPDESGSFTDDVRYTLTLIVNEIFRSLFAENYPYIVALTDCSFAGASKKCEPMTYSLEHVDGKISKNSIYIVEDSQLDLGLMAAVERNLHRILEIAADYLAWHEEYLTGISSSSAVDEEATFIIKEEPPKKERGVGGIIDKIRGGQRPEGKAPAEPEVEGTEDADESSDSFVKTVETTLHSVDVNVSSDGDTDADDKSGNMRKRKPYAQRHYLLYGFDSVPENVDIQNTYLYLSEMGFSNNSLRQARDGQKLTAVVDKIINDGKMYKEHCDFCGAAISGAEAETLADGRIRCMNCSATAIKTGEECLSIFMDTKRNYEAFFNVSFNADIRIEMVNSKKLHKSLNKTFVPTSEMDGRTLGVARYISGEYIIMIENGSPRMASIMTIAHELTHIWQFLNWDAKKIKKLYGRKLELEIYEGMAEWAEIQYAYLINEPSVAKRAELSTLMRDDEYGRGFFRYRSNYPLTTGPVLTKQTPFLDKQMPLGREYCGDIVKADSGK